MLKRVFCSVVCFLAVLMSSSNTEGAVVAKTGMMVDVRVNGTNDTISVPAFAYTEYSGENDGAMGCNDKKYNYSKVTAGPNWPIIINGFTFTEQHNKDYWAWVYDGYTVDGNGNCDWTQNCHGYAFGVGNWPDDSTIIKAAGSPVVNCWIQDMTDARIADNTGHTLKISVEDCPLSVGLKILATTEKFRESPKYKLTTSCNGQSIDLSLGNSPRGGMNNLVPYRQNS